jgi:hypothetical protein
MPANQCYACPAMNAVADKTRDEVNATSALAALISPSRDEDVLQ